MAESTSHEREVAATFLQAVRAKVFAVAYKLFPAEIASEIVDKAERRVEVEGQYAEDVETVCNWFRSESDVEWLEKFWQTKEGGRFLELSTELMMRSTLREFAPHVPVPPSTKS